MTTSKRVTRAVSIAGMVLGVYLIGRAIVELFTIDLSNAASYRNDWGGADALRGARPHRRRRSTPTCFAAGPRWDDGDAPGRSGSPSPGWSSPRWSAPPSWPATWGGPGPTVGRRSSWSPTTAISSMASSSSRSRRGGTCRARTNSGSRSPRKATRPRPTRSRASWWSCWSASAPQELPEGDPVEVGEHDGVVSHVDPEADILTYVDDAGHLVQVQAWRAVLGWSNEQLVRFAEGVQVTSHAQAGVG